MDVRDEITWVVLELTPQGERLAEDGQLADALRDVAKLESDYPVFVPYLSYVHEGTRSLFSVMEGYAFMASGLDRDEMDLILRSMYVRKFLSRRLSTRVSYETLPNRKIEDLRQSLREIVAVEIICGMDVVVEDGPLCGIKGKVVGVTDTHADLLVEMRSLRAIRHLPRFILRPVSDDP